MILYTAQLATCLAVAYNRSQAPIVRKDSLSANAAALLPADLACCMQQHLGLQPQKLNAC